MEDEPTVNDDQKQMLAQEEKLKRAEYTLDDFRKQMAMIAKPGFVQKMAQLLHIQGQLRETMDHLDVGAIRNQLGIIDAMTPAERSNARQIDGPRRHRIAVGAGCEPSEVDALVKQFQAMAGVMIPRADNGLRDRLDLLGEVHRKERDWPFKPNQDDDEDLPPDDPLSPMLA